MYVIDSWRLLLAAIQFKCEKIRVFFGGFSGMDLMISFFRQSNVAAMIYQSYDALNCSLRNFRGNVKNE